MVPCNNCFLVESQQNTSKHLKESGSRSELLILHTSQTFLKSSNSDFLAKVTKRNLSANIPLYEINNKHMKNLFMTLVTVCHLKLLVEKQYCN